MLTIQRALKLRKLGRRSKLTPHQRRYMDSKYTYERCSMSYVIRELQINTTMRCHYTLFLEWLKYKKLTILNAGEDAEQREFIAGGNAKW